MREQQIKKEYKDQESIQSSITPDTGYLIPKASCQQPRLHIRLVWSLYFCSLIGQYIFSLDLSKHLLETESNFSFSSFSMHVCIFLQNVFLKKAAQQKLPGNKMKKKTYLV